MKIIAHRGSSFVAPENTLAAIRLAIEEEADGVEFDVHRTRDGKVAVIHDDDTFRTTGMKAPVRYVSMDELKLLDAGCWKGNEWRCETVPELSEILGILPESMLAFIEIKCGPEILPALAEVVPSIGARALFVGFSLETMALTKQQFPGCKALWNLEKFPEPSEIVARARIAGVDGVGLGFSDAINEELVKNIHEASLEIFVWTVDDIEQAKNLRSLNVDYLATNRPGWLRESLGSIS
jgi:glycerophosphoryl diester phosphodiesterase